jgi:cell division protein FtsB
MAIQKSKFNMRKKKQIFRSIIPFVIVVATISGFIAYLWISSEVDETLNELELQQAAVVDLSNNINDLKDDIEYLERVDVLTALAMNELEMVFTTPETIAIYIDRSTLVED